jgi:hypothetical protein
MNKTFEVDMSYDVIENDFSGFSDVNAVDIPVEDISVTALENGYAPEFTDPSDAVFSGDSGLNVAPLKSLNAMVRKETVKGRTKAYKVKFESKAVSAKKVISTLQKMNQDVILVSYDEDLENNPDINVTEKPLWSVRNKSGTFIIQREK